MTITIEVKKDQQTVSVEFEVSDMDNVEFLCESRIKPVLAALRDQLQP